MSALEHEKPVELATAGFADSLKGFLTGMEVRRLKVRLQEPFDRERMRPGITVYVLMTVNGVEYRTPACLASLDGAVAEITLVQGNHYEERACPRRKCSLSVRFRAVHGSGCQGAWRHGVSADVSVEGMGLIIDSDVTIQERLEIWFCVEEAREIMRSPARTYSDDGQSLTHTMEANAIRAQAHAVRRKQLPTGEILIGLNFQSLMPKDRARLATYVSAGLEENEGA